MSALKNNKDKKKIAQGFFVTGTDTEVGKTLIASSIASKLRHAGKRVAVLKPVACGCDRVGDTMFNGDAVSLKGCGTRNDLLYSDINPFLFSDPIAPHIAAEQESVELSVKTITNKSNRVLTSDADYIVIEGAGGWCVPINDHETMADLALAYEYPVVLVVGIRLGCINHALLTYNNICSMGVKVHGWVANIVDKQMLCQEDNIAAIKSRIDAPLLGVVPYIFDPNPENVAELLSL